MSNHFGRVAVGCRLNKIEPAFFQCWTGLVVSGLDPGDQVLRPSYDMAAHKAANFLARQFLLSDCDTLLMVDDDMVFAPDALSALRTAEQVGQFDIVSALSTTRTYPPQLILKRLLDGQLDYPLSEQGQVFEAITDFERGKYVEVDVVGLAFTLIGREVFEGMVKHDRPELTYFFRYEQGLETEDISFCRDARELGFKLAVDTAVEVGHIGRKTWGPPDWYMMREAELLDTGAAIDNGGRMKSSTKHVTPTEIGGGL